MDRRSMLASGLARSLRGAVTRDYLAIEGVE